MTYMYYSSECILRMQQHVFSLIGKERKEAIRPNPSWLFEIMCATTLSSKDNIRRDDLLILHTHTELTNVRTESFVGPSQL